jgi:hypothetical protein
MDNLLTHLSFHITIASGPDESHERRVRRRDVDAAAPAERVIGCRCPRRLYGP